MSIKSLLGPESIALHLKGKTKEEVIDELLAVMTRTGKIADLAGARAAVLHRESRMSTGMQGGLALPHGKIDSIQKVVAVLGVSDKGVDFDSLDREASRIFVLTLSPASQTGPHLRFLADAGLAFGNAAIREAVLAAQSPEEAYKALGASPGQSLS